MTKLVGLLTFKNKTPNNSGNCMKAYISHITIIMVLTTILSGCTGYEVQEITTQPTPQISNKTTEQINVEICENIVEEYHKTHTYIGSDIYVCGDMAEDVWNMVITKGMNAEIMMGNVDIEIHDINLANHAWVVAEIGDDNWLDLEPTGGYIVHSKDNPRYYTGWNFYNPKDFREYLELRKLYNQQLEKYNQALEEYNELVEIYNRSDNNTKWAMVSQINAKIELCNARAKDVQDTANKISYILNK